MKCAGPKTTQQEAPGVQQVHGVTWIFWDISSIAVSGLENSHPHRMSVLVEADFYPTSAAVYDKCVRSCIVLMHMWDRGHSATTSERQSA